MGVVETIASGVLVVALVTAASLVGAGVSAAKAGTIAIIKVHDRKRRQVREIIWRVIRIKCSAAHQV
jgi:hypothetical protein